MIQVLFIAGVVISYIKEEVLISDEEKQIKSDKKRAAWRERTMKSLVESEIKIKEGKK